MGKENNIDDLSDDGSISHSEDYKKQGTKKKANIGETLTGLLSRKMSMDLLFNNRKGTHFGKE
jgi:hypothetical protein